MHKQIILEGEDKMKRNNISVLVIVIIILTLTFSMSAIAFAQSEENEKVELVNDLSMDTVEHVRMSDNKTGISATSDYLKVEIEKKDVSEINISAFSELDENEYDLAINLPIENDAKTDVIDNSIVSIDNNFSTVTEIREGELNINFIIENEGAPEYYALDYDIPKGAKLQFASYEGEKDGSVEIVDKEGVPFCAIGIPWAKDSKGNDIDTYYEIKGNQLIQVVNHKNCEANYPIVADPKNKYSDWFKSATWKTRSDGRYLCVIPTNWNRQSGIAYASTSWALLKAKKSSSKYWKNEGGLKDQYYCHTQLAKLKSSWNLEPWRPNVGLAKTIAKACNP